MKLTFKKFSWYTFFFIFTFILFSLFPRLFCSYENTYQCSTSIWNGYRSPSSIGWIRGKPYISTNQTHSSKWEPRERQVKLWAFDLFIYFACCFFFSTLNYLSQQETGMCSIFCQRFYGDSWQLRVCFYRQGFIFSLIGLGLTPSFVDQPLHHYPPP